MVLEGEERGNWEEAAEGHSLLHVGTLGWARRLRVRSFLRKAVGAPESRASSHPYHNGTGCCPLPSNISQ